MRARWEHQNFTIWAGGYTYRNVLTIERPEVPGYEVTGHSAILRMRRPGEDESELEVALIGFGTPTLSTVQGVPNTFVASFALVLAQSQIASLVPGGFYDYTVDLLDSRGETEPAVKGVIYVGRPF
jgi:hypothetical protein